MSAVDPTNIDTSNDAASNADLVKAKISQATSLMKTREARKFLAKRQLERGNGNPDTGQYELRARQHNGDRGPGDIAKADGYIRTIYDMVDLHYGFVPSYLGKDDGGLSKATMTSDMRPGVANVVYGQEVFSIINSEANVFSLFEKRPWRRSGVRYVDSHGHTLGSGGEAENASLPTPQQPSPDTYELTPRSIVHNFSVSQIEQLLADTEDDHFADNPMDWLRRWFGQGTEHQTGQGAHPKHINVQLTDGVAGGKQDSNNMESIDRALSNSEEAGILSDGSNADYYDFDRSAGEFEANVIHNGGTLQNLVMNHLDSAITSVREASGKDPVTDNSYFWLTNHEAFQIIEEEVAAKERLEPVRTQVGMNGVQTQPGDDVGITVQAYKDIPIFRSDDIVEDGTGRIYLVDSDTMFIKQLLPTQYYDTGINVDNNPFAIDRLGNEGMFLTVGELALTNPSAHCKIRDLN